MVDFGIVVAILSAFFLGTNKLAIRKSLFDIDESVASLIAILVSIPIFGLPILLFGWGTNVPSTRVILIFVIAGILNFSAGRYFIWKSISKIGANRGNILASSQVIYAIVISIFFLRQTVAEIAGVGVILVLLGILIISYRGFKSPSFVKKDVKIGLAAGVIGGFLWGISQVLMQIGIAQYGNATGATFITYAAGLVGILPIIFVVDRYSTKNAFRITRSGLLYVVLAGLLATFGLFFRYVALETIPLTLVSTINAINPMITLVLSYFLIREMEYIDRVTVLGIMASVVGVVVISL